MATLTHAGRLIVSDENGGWVHTPAARGNEVQMVRLARATRRKAKDLGKAGCSITLTVDYAGDPQYFRTRIENLYDMTIGNLVVPTVAGTDVYEDCLFVGSPDFNDVVPLANGKCLITATITLEQL